MSYCAIIITASNVQTKFIVRLFRVYCSKMVFPLDGATVALLHHSQLMLPATMRKTRIKNTNNNNNETIMFRSHWQFPFDFSISFRIIDGEQMAQAKWKKNNVADRLQLYLRSVRIRHQPSRPSASDQRKASKVHSKLKVMEIFSESLTGLDAIVLSLLHYAHFRRSGIQWHWTHSFNLFPNRVCVLAWMGMEMKRLFSFIE